MATTNKYKASITLGIVSLGFFASHPFNHDFAGGLISSACGAAMIGGLADWFAVSALFRRPLGIPFRTAIIPRNREKIFNSLANMVEQELLTAENIHKTLERYNLTELFMHYLVDHDGADDIRRAFAKIISNIITKINPDKIGRIVELVVKKNIEKADAATILADGLEWFVKYDYDAKITEFAADQLINLVKHDQMKELLVELLTEARRTYERGLVKRKVFNLLLNISPEEIAVIIQQLFVSTLAGMKAEEHPIHPKMKQWLNRFIGDLRTDPELRQKVEAWKLRQLHDLHIRQGIANAIEVFRQDSENSEEAAGRWVEQFTWQFDRWMSEFAHDEERRAVFDGKAKQAITGWALIHHGAINGIVRDSLNQLSDEMLVNYIEEKVGDDLQMIRINGSVVGGVIGLVIFLIHSWLIG